MNGKKLTVYDVKEGYGFSLTNDETDWIVGLIFLLHILIEANA